jgi:hypothetical protein
MFELYLFRKARRQAGPILKAPSIEEIRGFERAIALIESVRRRDADQAPESE